MKDKHNDLNRQISLLENSVEKLLLLVEFYKKKNTDMDKIEQEREYYKNLCHRQQKKIHLSIKELKSVKEYIYKALE